ncbi:MAG: hypothetical protein AAFY71_06620 [Bacteroidota bacterium]
MARNFLPSLRSPQQGNLYGYALPKGLVDIKIMFFEGKELTLEIKEVKYVPDPDHFYHFRYQPSAFSEDDIVVKYGPLGFLSHVHTQIDDQTDDVFSSLADMVGNLADSLTPKKKTKVTKARSTGNPPKLIFEGIIDPFSDTDTGRVDKALKKLNQKLSFETRILGQKGNPTSKEIPEIKDRSGLFCKTRALVEMGIFSEEGNETQYLELPHPNNLEFIEIPTASFVKTEFEITFSKEGYPTYIHINKPSSALAIIQAPLNLFKAILMVPATLFQFKVNLNNVKAQAVKSEYDYRKRMLELDEYVIKLQEREGNGGEVGESK